MKTVLHVDMDAFFAAVEQREHPEWRGKPVIVGSGPHERGVVSTCSYEARRFGVRSAMPSRTAYTLCPHAIFVPPHMTLYEEVSAKAFEIFARYTPYVEGVSIDEAFLDISGSIHLYGSARALGESLRGEIRRICGVTCSVGIASNRLMAKIGSELHKPDGLSIMPTNPDEIAAFLRPRPITTLWGVGKKTVDSLRPYGIATCGDLQRLQPSHLVSREIIDLAFGRSDDAVHWEESAEKSVSREHTFRDDVTSRNEVRTKLLELVKEVGIRFRRERRWAQTARLKLRDASFNTITRQMTFSEPVRDDMAFREAALELFNREHFAAVRLIGFGVANFTDSPARDSQPQLFANPHDAAREKRERLSLALDELHARGLM